MFCCCNQIVANYCKMLWIFSGNLWTKSETKIKKKASDQISIFFKHLFDFRNGLWLELSRTGSLFSRTYKSIYWFSDIFSFIERVCVRSIGTLEYKSNCHLYVILFSRCEHLQNPLLLGFGKPELFFSLPGSCVHQYSSSSAFRGN